MFPVDHGYQGGPRDSCVHVPPLLGTTRTPRAPHTVSLTYAQRFWDAHLVAKSELDSQRQQLADARTRLRELAAQMGLNGCSPSRRYPAMS